MTDAQTGSAVRERPPRAGATRDSACRLIINVDDFGWSEGVNAAVCELYDEGIVTSTSMMVGGFALDDAVSRAQARPGLAVGLHLALVAAPPVLPVAEVPHLVGANEWFTDNCTVAANRYTFIRACHAEIRREVEAQFRAFARCGLAWSHVDSHRHLGLVPVIFHEAVRLGRECGAAGFRVPEDDFRLYRRMDPADARRQRGLAAIFAWLCGTQRRALAREPFLVPRWCYGLFRTGRLSEAYLAQLVAEMPDGCFELHCHPDVSTERGRAEQEALRSRGFRRALEARGVQLSTYASARAVETSC
jgi:hopanoid biosynthesis associated protein HpnK